jgi:hypothetical protein
MVDVLGVFLDYHKNNPDAIVNIDYINLLVSISLTNSSLYSKIKSLRLEIPFAVDNSLIYNIRHIFCARWVKCCLELNGDLNFIAKILAAVCYFENKPMNLTNSQKGFLDHPFWDQNFVSKIKRLQVGQNLTDSSLVQLPPNLQELFIHSMTPDKIVLQLSNFNNITKFISNAKFDSKTTYPSHLTYLRLDTCSITVEDQLPKTLTTLMIKNIYVTPDVIDKQKMPPMEIVALGYGEKKFLKNFSRIRKFIDYGRHNEFFERILKYSISVDIVEIPDIPTGVYDSSATSLHLGCNIDIDVEFVKRNHIGAFGSYSNNTSNLLRNICFSSLTIIKIYCNNSFNGCDLSHLPLKKFALYANCFGLGNHKSFVLPKLEDLFIHLNAFERADPFNFGAMSSLTNVVGSLYYNIQCQNIIYDFLIKNTHTKPLFKNLYVRYIMPVNIEGLNVVHSMCETSELFSKF